MQIGQAGWLSHSINFRFVQMLAGWQIGVFLKMCRAQRFGNGVLAAEPFAEVNQLATVRAERPVFSGEPVTALFADWAFDLRHGIILFPLQFF
jgi:hypothetical protein